MGKEVNEVINNICDKLGYAASEITPEMAKYMIAKDTFTVGICALLVIASIICIIAAVKHNDKMKVECNYNYEGTRESAITLIGAVVFIFSGLILIMTSIDLVGWLASPKASMVEYVLTAIK